MDYVRAVAERLAAFTNSAREAIDETDKLVGGALVPNPAHSRLGRE